MYYDCRYVSACEAAWRIFGFEIQYKDPSVERLSFHLPNEQHVIFYEADSLDDVLNRRTIYESKFLGWMEANKVYSEGRNLTYGEFPTKFVWKKIIGNLENNVIRLGGCFMLLLALVICII